MQDVPKIVRERLQRATTALHPDADLLTAFAEQSLAAGERDNVMKHLAQCGDCREIVMLALPEAQDAVQAAFESQTRTNWLHWPALRWAVVAAGILVVTSVAVLQLRQHQGRTQVATSLVAKDRLAGAEQGAPVSAARPATPSPALSTSAESASSSLPPMVRGPQVSTEKKAEAGDRIPLIADKSGNANSPFPRSIGGPVSREVTPNHALAYAPAAESAGNVAAAKQNPSAPSSSEVVEVTGEAPLVQTETPAKNATRDQLAAQNQGSDTLQLSGKQSEAVVRAKPTLAQDSSGFAAGGSQKDGSLQKSAALRWTISASGALQRSLDGGKTWMEVNLAADSSVRSNLVGQSQSEMVVVMPAQTRSAKKTDAKSAPAPPVPVIFRALSVSSNAAEVWAGGAAGLLYHTMDGGDLWVRVVPSEAGVPLNGDIVSIEFSDPRNGTVTTSNASIWTTNDNGQTWHKQQ